MRINLITYNSVITALSRASKMNAKFSESGNVDNDQLWIRALELIEQIQSDGLIPDGFSYSAAISCCGAGGRWKEALDLIKTMQKDGPKTRPNKIAYTAAICELICSAISLFPFKMLIFSRVQFALRHVSCLRKIWRI